MFIAIARKVLMIWTYSDTCTPQVSQSPTIPFANRHKAFLSAKLAMQCKKCERSWWYKQSTLCMWVLYLTCANQHMVKDDSYCKNDLSPGIHPNSLWHVLDCNGINCPTQTANIVNMSFLNSLCQMNIHLFYYTCFRSIFYWSQIKLCHFYLK